MYYMIQRQALNYFNFIGIYETPYVTDIILISKYM